MVYVKKGERNVFGLTLSENTDIPNPFFLFRILSNGAKKSDEILIKLTDISNAPQRMNVFEFVEGTDMTLERGEYTYEVYATETDEDEPTGQPIETGRINVELSTDEDDKGQNNQTESAYK